MARRRATTAIEVSGVSKRFRMPLERAMTFKERAVHPFAREQYRELNVLEDISFDVARGEFFGIVGRNGSGKSTLLKLIASVYSVDSGRIRVAGSVAPVIELGVGFQPELTARENVELNALMMGLGSRDAKRRFDEVIRFAELEEYVNLKLRNYSTGMQARLAFAIAMQADPDILLLDEVLAVGDASFQKRCTEAFEEIKARGRTTVVLVTHALAHIEAFCDRAMLIEGGRIDKMGEPRDVAMRHQQLQSAAAVEATSRILRSQPELKRSPARIRSLRVVTAQGRKVERLRPGGSIRLQAVVDTRANVDDPRLAVWITGATGLQIFAPPLIELGGESGTMRRGEQVDVRIRFENKLAPGRYGITGVVATGPENEDAPVSDPFVIHFEVNDDGRASAGSVSLDYEFRVGRSRRRRRVTQTRRREAGR